jgi:hypothetical protein
VSDATAWNDEPEDLVDDRFGTDPSEVARCVAEARSNLRNVGAWEKPIDELTDTEVLNLYHNVQLAQAELDRRDAMKALEDLRDEVKNMDVGRVEGLAAFWRARGAK